MTRRSSPALAMLLLACAADAGESRAPQQSAGRFLYIPPEIEDRVVFYHSFENGVDRPEIDLLDARVGSGSLRTEDGLAGSGLEVHDAKAARNPLRVRSGALSPQAGITVSMWWRADEEMKPETCYHLASLRGKGHISAFVRGKGGWCALKEPTFVFQVWGFPGMANRNDIRTGAAWAEPGEWHHVAMTVALGSEVSVYWDGNLRARYSTKGRDFVPEDDVELAEFGPTWLFHPMTIDEVFVCDRALKAEEIAGYVAAVRALAEVGFPHSDGRGPK